MRQEEEPHTLCLKCSKFIRTENYLIHEARCKGQASSRIFQRNLPSRMQRSSMVLSRMKERPGEQLEIIPCPFCGYQQTLEELDTHPNQCAHRDSECSDCHETFPMSLIDEHRKVCRETYRRQRNARRQPRRRMSPNYQRQVRERQFSVEANPFVRVDQLMGSLANRHMNRLSMREESESPRQMARLRQEELGLASPGFGFLISLLAGRRGAKNKGISRSQLNRLPKAKYRQKGEEPDLCSICYCNFQEDQECMTVPCMHIYHPECITKWLQSNDKCPICKHSVRSSDQQSDDQSSPSRVPELWRFQME